MRLQAALAALLAVNLLVPVSAAQINTRPIGVSEADLKAVFVLRLLDFIQREEPLENTRVCLLGRTETTAAIERLVVSKGSSDLSIRELGEDAPYGSCHLLFDGGGFLSQLGEEESYPHVLTVSDSEGFASRGGMVELVRENNRVKLTINAATVDAADIYLSSRLLMLADVIEADERVKNGD